MVGCKDCLRFCNRRNPCLRITKNWLLPLKLRQFILNNCPDSLLVHREVVMDKDVSHGNYLLTGHFGVRLPESFRHLPRRFPDYLKVVYRPCLNQFVLLKGVLAFTGIAIDSFDCLKDIYKPVGIFSQSGTASLRALPRTL